MKMLTTSPSQPLWLSLASTVSSTFPPPTLEWQALNTPPPLPAMTFDLTWLLLEHTKGGGRGTSCPSTDTGIPQCALTWGRRNEVCVDWSSEKRPKQCGWVVAVRMMSSQLDVHPVIFAAVSPPPSLAESSATGAFEKKRCQTDASPRAAAPLSSQYKATAHSKGWRHAMPCLFVCSFACPRSPPSQLVERTAKLKPKTPRSPWKWVRSC